MNAPAPSEGEQPLDPQSETVGRPVRDEAPPVRTRRTPLITALLVAAWIALGIVLLVLALSLI